MLKSANLLLSDKELQLVSDDSWIMMKEAILQKVAGIFGQLPEMISHSLEPNVPDLHLQIIHSPKISRGERYLGLPYLVLDYPRQFGKEDVFAIRTMFWWANYFSVSLQLAGTFRKKFGANVSANIEKDYEGFFICIHEDPWQHAITDDYYLPVTNETLPRVASILKEHRFIKLTRTISLSKWNNLEAELKEAYRKMSGLLA